MIQRYVSSGNILPWAPESSLKLMSVSPTRISDTHSSLRIVALSRFSTCTAPKNKSSVSESYVTKSTSRLVSPGFLTLWKATKCPQPWHCLHCFPYAGHSRYLCMHPNLRHSIELVHALESRPSFRLVWEPDCCACGGLVWPLFFSIFRYWTPWILSQRTDLYRPGTWRHFTDLLACSFSCMYNIDSLLKS